MDQDFLSWLDAQQGGQYELHERYINPAFVKTIRTIGFDKGYVRGEGPWLFDAEGRRYLDLLTGWGGGGRVSAGSRVPCRKAGALLVADEVQCGLGRTGKWFAYQHWPEAEPDIVCVSKAL